MNNFQKESTTFPEPAFDYLILGAGMAGLTLAIELSKRGGKVCILDIAKPGAGASGSPGGLMNPATAQKARMPKDAPECVSAFLEMLDFVLDGDSARVVLHDKVLRPAVDETLRDNFRDSIVSGSWPESWMEWKNAEAIAEELGIKSHGGLLLNIGKGIDFRAWIAAMDAKITRMGVMSYYDCEYRIKRTPDYFEVDTERSIITSKFIIDCTGSEQRYKSDYRMTLVKGQTRVVPRPAALNLPVAVSSYGYLLADDSRVIIGSTYEHHFDSLDPTERHDGQILKKSGIINGFNVGINDITERWSGIRVSTPDRIPAIGPSQADPNFYLYFGLGSKGLFYSSYLSGILADHLAAGKAIPDRFLASRFLK